jgi:CHAT domain-containing protein
VERAEVLERIRFSDSRWRSLSEPIAFDLSATIKTLNERKQSALHLFYRPDFVVAVLIKRGECVASSINISNATIEKLRKYIENLQANTPQPKWYDPSTGMELSAVDLIPTNLLASAIKETSLIIIPHGPLHLIPWAGMTFEEKRLIEYCPVGILPNLSCLRALQINFADRPRVALVGAPDYRKIIGLNPLYYAEEELKTIEDIYSHKDGVINSVLEGKRANEENYWKLARHPDSAGNILHIACHGSFVKGDPMNSGLLMSDSRIDASEIARSPIKYDEIILSACSTGYRPTEVGGVLLSGDDILGLPGAFLEAGARSVLVSIPYARDDAALQFMTIYHENREEGKTPLIALQETQKTMLSDAHYPPYLWIGFTIYGCQ